MRTRLWAVVAASLLVLAGCGGNPEPKTLPSRSVSPSPSASASPTPTPPVLPAGTHEKTRAGALATANTFIATVNYAGATGDINPLRAIYIPHCTRCESLAAGIEQTYESGGSFNGGDWTPTRSKFYGIRGDVAFVDVLVDTSEQTWVPRAGAKPRHFDASTSILKALNLRWVGRSWRISALDPDR